MSSFQKITPFLWFDNQAENAARHYLSFFSNSRINKITYHDDRSSKAAGLPKGSVMTVEFELEGQLFTAMNGGPNFRQNHVMSFTVTCESPEDADYYWERLAEEAAEKDVEQLWLRDKYGVTWQIIPVYEINFSEDPDKDRAQRFVQAMIHMNDRRREESRKAA